MAELIPDVCTKGKLNDNRLERLAEESATNKLSEESWALLGSLLSPQKRAVDIRTNQLTACLQTGLAPHYYPSSNGVGTRTESLTVTGGDGRQKVITNR